MQIKLENLDAEDRLSIQGPQVDVVLDDEGQANVALHLSISDGTHFHFPDGSGRALPRSTVLPPGDYSCVLLIAAFNHGSFGATYSSVVKVAGVIVARAKGRVPAGEEFDNDLQTFVLRVQ